MEKRRLVEYTFKNSFKDKPVTITLRPFSILVQCAGIEQKIPFARVTSVHLSRRPGNLFRTAIEIEDGNTVIVTNRFYLTKDQYEDRNNAYGTFIRVLHHHLKEKSDAVFSSGISYNTLVLMALIVCFSSFLVSFIAEYLGLPMNPFFLATALSVAGMTGIVIYQKRKISRQYNPADIPLQFLP